MFFMATVTSEDSPPPKIKDAPTVVRYAGDPEQNDPEIFRRIGKTKILKNPVPESEPTPVWVLGRSADK